MLQVYYDVSGEAEPTVFILSTNPELIALIERPRARQANEGGLSGEEVNYPRRKAEACV